MGVYGAGKIALDRKLLDWEWFDDGNVLRLWIYILLRANWKDEEWRGQTIKRGSFKTSYASMSSATGLTVKEVRTAMSKLRSTGEIITQATNKWQLVIVAKYDEYQIVSNSSADKRQADGQASGTQGAVKGQQMNKENKGINNNNILYSAATAEVISYLNQKIGSRYSPTSKDTKSHISARLKEGYTVEDFKTVIDKKTDEWLGDPKMCQFLRPKTLFGTKFESYLNQPVVKTTGNQFLDLLVEEGGYEF